MQVRFYLWGTKLQTSRQHVRDGPLARSYPETGQVTAKETAKSTQRGYLF